MPDIFLSYSSPDADFAARLAADLRRYGADVWLGGPRREEAPSTVEQTQAALDTSRVMVLVVSPPSLRSASVTEQWQYFLNTRRLPLIPVVREPASLHFQLARIQYIDFTDRPYETAFAALHTAVKAAGVAVQPLPTHKVPETRRPEPARTPGPAKLQEGKGGRGCLWFLGLVILAAMLVLNLPYFNNRHHFEPVWSPDGEWIAFTIYEDGNNEEVYAVRVDGTDYRRLTNNQPDDTLAEWSPDSRYIAVNSGRSGGDEIMVVDVENNASTLITHNRDTGLALSHPVWSPDSTRLALVSESNLYLVNRDGSDLHLVGNAGFDYISGAALWSPDGERILLVGSVDRARRLGVAELTTGTMQEIAAGASSVGSPMWLPDGQQIALETGAEGGCDHGIVLVNVVRGDLRIVGEGRPASQVCFLLDVLNANTLLVQKKDALYTLDVSSGTATRFGDPPPSGSLVAADWQYATEVLGEYNAPKGLSDQIWLTDLTTGERRRIFAGDHRSPRDLAFSPDGAALAMGMDKLSDGIDIMLLDLSGEGEPRNLTARSLIARWIASRGGEILD